MNNLHLINAPAGSGKTYYIKEKINEILVSNKEKRILCITYTDRAAEELKSRIISKDVEIRTIHSFMNHFLSPFFSLEEAINFFMERYKNQIESKLSETEDRDVQRFIKKYDITEPVSFDLIKKYMTKIYYNEQVNNNLLFGGISHDELLVFSLAFLKKYPIIKLKGQEMYTHIFIDEAQDTNANVMRFFYDTAKGTNTELFVFMDKMQEIYDNYDGSFEEEFGEFENSESDKFDKNYRSSQEILSILSKLYVSNKLKIDQSSQKGYLNKIPKLHVVKSVDDFFNKNLKTYNEYLKLRVHNIKRFENQGNSLDEIYRAYTNIYPSYSRISAIDVLLPKKDESEDLLLNFIFKFDEIIMMFQNELYGEAIQIIKNYHYRSGSSKKNVFNLKRLTIKKHSDKKKYYQLLSIVIKKFKEPDDDLLFEFFELLYIKEFISKSFYYDVILYESKEGYRYTDILSKKTNNFVELCELNRNSMISTQHGVKGEGHKKVVFAAENSKNPSVKMYEFFRLYSTLDNFNLDDFQSFYYSFSKDIESFEKENSKKISKFLAADRDKHASFFSGLFEKYKDDIYFLNLNCQNISFEKKMSVKDFKKMFSVSNIRGCLTAYKLFYVGCSRAEEELTVVVEDNSIEPFKTAFIEKMTSIGFQVEED